jgi:predicted nucleotide-binding protein (sugar kinase/HSP70/actin superfamily)
MSIEVDTLDNILRDLGIFNVDFISIEINGAEIEALEGMKKTFDQDVNLVIAAQYNRFGQPSYKTVVPMLKKRGFYTLVEFRGKVYASKVSKKKGENHG